MQTRFLSVTTLLLFWTMGLCAHAKPTIQGEMAHQGDTAHLEFKGVKNWQYEVQRDGKKKVVLTLPAIDDASAAKVQAFSDSLVNGVEINRSGPDGTYQISFSLGGTDVEAFDYLTDEPSRLIIDFYRKPQEEVKPVVQASTPVVAPIAAAPAASGPQKTGDLPKKITTTAQKFAKARSKKNTRKPAGDEVLSVPAQLQAKTLTPTEDDPAATKTSPIALRYGIFDGGDENYDRFRLKDYEVRDEAIVASRQNIYLPFPMLKMQLSKLDELMALAPEYVIRPTDTRENKEARLLLTLYERGRVAVFLKTFDYFVGKYPESPYLEIVKNIAADIHMQNWRAEGKATSFDTATSLYKELVEKYPTSPLRERNSLVLDYALLERGESLLALQFMQNFLTRFPSSKEIPQIRKGMADALITLRKFDEATEQYKILMKDYPKSIHAFEAQYRMGDVWFAKGDYNQAIQTYEKTIKSLPEQEKVFANADYNLAEAHFWQKDYKKALNQYITFVNHFPTHAHGGYALTRIGELLDIFGVDQRRPMGAFLESYFRFPAHPGAAIARMRMLSQQMRGMKEKELKKALEEIAGIAEHSKLSGVQEFTTLMVAEGLQNRGEFVKALDYLITYYQKNPDSLNLDPFRARILRNISNEIKARSEKGDFLTALDFFSKYSDNWLKNSDRIDVPFYLAKSYETAGAFGEAEKLYTEALSRRKAILGTERERERRVQENLPSVESVRLRIAASYLANRKYMEAYDQLKAIGEGKNLNPQETVERVELAAQVYEQRSEVAKAREALRELTSHWKGDPELLASAYSRLADINLKGQSYKEAEENASKVLEMETEDSKLPEKTLVHAYQVKGESLAYQGRSLAAAEVYQTLLEKFEEKQPLGVTRYKLGKILFDRGDVKGAEAVWQRLAGGPNTFLWKLGQEKIKAASWQDEYTKYTQRIPAMVQEKKQEKRQ